MGTASTRTGVAPQETANIESVARSFIEAFNRRDFDYGASLVADDAEFVLVPWAATARGPEGYRLIENNWARAFPDGQVEVLNVVCHGDICAVEMIGRGTHNGPFMNADGREIPATGKRGEIRMCDIIQFKNGKVFRERSYFDSASLMRQLGVAD